MTTDITAPAPPAHYAVPFDLGEDARGPMMWGQKAIWNVLTWLAPGQEASLNQLVVAEVSGLGVPDVLAVFSALVARHDSLRTLAEMVDGEPRQLRIGQGTIEVWSADCSSDGSSDGSPDGSSDGGAQRAAEDLAEQLRCVPFDLARDLPVRCGIVLRDGLPAKAFLVLSHLAADASSLRIVANELNRALAGEDLGPRSQQPLDRAHWEASEAGQRRQRSALEYWSDCTRTMSATWLENLRVEGKAEMAWARLRSPALATVAQEIAAEHRLTTATVLQALISLTLAIEHGTPDAALRCIVATRFTPQTAGLVGAFNLNALFRLDLIEETAAEFFGRARRAAMLALANCECHQDALNGAVEEIARERGIIADGYCFYNDIRPNAGPTPVSGAAVAPGLLDRSVVEVPDLDGDQRGSKFFMYVSALEEVADLTLCADRRFVVADRFMRDLDWVAWTMWRTGGGPLDVRRAYHDLGVSAQAAHRRYGGSSADRSGHATEPASE